MDTDKHRSDGGELENGSASFGVRPSSAAGTSAGSGAQDCPHTGCRPVLLRPRTGALRLVALLRRAADIAPCPSVTAGRDFPPAPEWCGSDSQPVPEV